MANLMNSTINIIKMNSKKRTANFYCPGIAGYNHILLIV